MKLLSWNILQGGGKRAGRVVETIAGHGPDIISFQEFRRGSGEKEIVEGLKKMGLKHIHIPETENKENTILVASKYPFDAGPFLEEPNSPLHLLEAYFSDEYLGFELSLIAVHFPQKKAQIPLFKALKDDSESLLKLNTLIIGDMLRARRTLKIISCFIARRQRLPFHRHPCRYLSGTICVRYP